jgi:hypothetical protein
MLHSPPKGHGILVVCSIEKPYRTGRAGDLGSGSVYNSLSNGPGGGCARRPVGTYPYLHAVGAGNPIAVPGLARWGAERGTDSCDPRDQHLSGSHVRRVLKKHNIRTHAQGSPAQPVRYVFSATKYSQILSRRWGGGGVFEIFFGEEGY